MDLKSLKGDDVQVNEKRKTVTIKLPQPRILDVSLDEKQTRVYDRDIGLWRRIALSEDLVEDTRDEAQDRLEAEARNKMILDRAETNAESSIRSFVTALGFKEVRFVE